MGDGLGSSGRIDGFSLRTVVSTSNKPSETPRSVPQEERDPQYVATCTVVVK